MGCAKNSVDSEHLMGLLLAAGHEFVENAEDAEVGLINTCAFIQDAVKENVDTILDLELWKEQGVLKKIIVVGCLVNRYEADLQKELPSVDLWAGAEDWSKVITFLGGEVFDTDTNCAPRGILPENRVWSRYLKVGEGCDTFCSYCTIPMIRGRLRSIPVAKLVEEALNLCRQGAREICLVGQDLTVYGLDLSGKPLIRELLSALNNSLPEGTWIRLLYLHPDRIDQEFIEFLMSLEKVLPYLDIPIQHIDDTILKSMNRSPVSGQIKEIFRYIREKNPFYALRTTLMVGFPGENEQQFEKILDFLDEAEIDRVGAFMYSPEEGTTAAKFPDQLDQSVKEVRYQRLMELQSEISRRRNLLFLGQKLTVLVEEVDGEDNSAWGRSYRDAPEVDGMVKIEGAGRCLPGSFVEVLITDAEDHDLFGQLI